MTSKAKIPSEPFAIGDVRVEPTRLKLDSPLGQSQLEPKVMQLLQVLASQAGETLTRDALIDSVWGVQYGGDESLSRAVSLLRKALQVPHGIGDVIRTIPRRGYVLEAKIGFARQKKRSTPESSSELIAILPFDNLSSDTDTQFFSDGISEDIIERLIRGTDLHVIGRTSSFQFRGDRKFKAAKELGASYIVDGSVRRAGNRVRISAHLEQAQTRETLWSDRYDRELEDIFAVQDEISEQIALALDRKMEAQRQTAMAPEMYDLFLKGYDWTYSTERLKDAMSALEKVTEVAPDFAPAWGALARNRAMMRMYQPVTDRNALDTDVRTAINQALALDPRNRDALNASYQRLDHFGPMIEHHDAIGRLREMGGNSATGLFLVSFHETCIGRMKLALDTAIEGARLDPLNPMSASYPGVVKSYLGHYDEAREDLELSLARWPEENGVRGTLLYVLGLLGDMQRIKALTDPAVLRRYPMAELTGVVPMAELLACRDTTKQQQFAQVQAERFIRSGAADPNNLLELGTFGDVDLFYDVLDKIRLGPIGAPDDSIGTIAYRSTLLFRDHNKALRSDIRFIKLCARLGLVKFWIETGIRPDFADEVEYDFDVECRAHADTPIDRYNPFKE